MDIPGLLRQLMLDTPAAQYPILNFRRQLSLNLPITSLVRTADSTFWPWHKIAAMTYAKIRRSTMLADSLLHDMFARL